MRSVHRYQSFKGFYIFTFILLIVVVTPSCNRPVKGANGVTYRSAVEYNDYIVHKQTDIMQAIMNVGKAADISLDSADQVLDDLVVTIGNVVADVKGMPAYRGDSSLREAAVNSFGFYKRIAKNEYRQIIQLRREGITENSEGMAKLNSILAKMTDDEKKYDADFQAAQQDFARKNNVKLAENEMQKEIDNDLKRNQ